MTRTRRHLAAALLTAVAGGTAGWAQTVSPPPSPAAKLLPARPVLPGDGAIVSRGYAPEPGTFGDTRPQPKTLTEQRSWTGAPLQAGTASPPRPSPSMPLPEPRRQPTPPPPVVAQSPVSPAYTNGATGVYAGPPAYRWYGYGSTTPGANPLAPTGQYPKGSANWYAQTGATPGAFPVPVTAGGEPVPRFEPPAYASTPPPPAPTYTTIPRDTRPVPSFVPPELPAPNRPVSTLLPSPTVVPPPPLLPSVVPPPAEPARPTGEPTPITVSTAVAPSPEPAPVITAKKVDAAPMATPAPVLPPAAGLSWQTATGPKDSLTFTAARPAEPIAKPTEPIATSAPPPVVPAEVVPAPLTFKPSLPAPPALPKDEPAPLTFRPSLSAPPVPALDPPPLPAAPVLPPAVLPPPTDWKTAPQARGQQPTDEAVSLTAQLRNACYGLATVAQVTQTGPSVLTVRLAAASEADARTAAGYAAKLPALRPYTVRFVIEVAGR